MGKDCLESNITVIYGLMVLYLDTKIMLINGGYNRRQIMFVCRKCYITANVLNLLIFAAFWFNKRFTLEALNPAIQNFFNINSIIVPRTKTEIMFKCKHSNACGRPTNFQRKMFSKRVKKLSSSGANYVTIQLLLSFKHFHCCAE